MVVGNNPAMQLEQQRALVSDGRVLTAVRIMPLRRLVETRGGQVVKPHAGPHPAKEADQGV